jgi:hypothetical protein
MTRINTSKSSELGAWLLKSIGGSRLIALANIKTPVNQMSSPKRGNAMRYLTRAAFTLAVATLVDVLVFESVKLMAAPSGLYGKSVIVGWTETREQTFEGETKARNISVSVDLKIYVSTAGRAFAKFFARGSRRSAESEQGPTDSSTVGAVHFQGNSMFVDKQMESGARRIMITFGSEYTACEARILYGKENGAGQIRRHGIISGKSFVVHSLRLSGASCSVRNGNVFGG